MTAQQIEQRLAEVLTGCEAKASDMTGGGDHWQLSIKAPQFAGLSLVKKHQLVYQALGTWMQKDIHALAIKIVD